MGDAKTCRDIVVVGASAGGVEALINFFSVLPTNLCAAVFVVLHVPPGAPSQLASILSHHSGLPTTPGVDKEVFVLGHVYVSSADRHLMIEADRVRITRGPREIRSRPSVDVLFRSASIACGARVISVILSGALDDGTAGSWTVKDRGGIVLVQAPADAMHASMPESVIKHVEVDHVGTAQELAHAVAGLVGSPASAPQVSADAERSNVETLIAMEGNGLNARVMALGKISQYACPECHGVLVQIEEGAIVRFRCHTGHAFSLLTLLAEITESVDKGLWDTLRAVEERVMLLRQMERRARLSRFTAEADHYKRQADQSDQKLKPLRRLVLDPEFFGFERRL